MGCIIKPAGVKEFTENGNIPKDIKRARKLAKKGKLVLVKKKTFGVIVYSETDFAACFVKHIRGVANDDKEYTVLKRKDGKEISVDEFRALFELAVQQIPRDKAYYYVALPAKDYQVVWYFKDMQKANKPVKPDAQLFFKDFLIRDSVDKIAQHARKYNLTAKDIAQAKDAVKRYESEHPDEGLSYIFVIGHSDIR